MNHFNRNLHLRILCDASKKGQSYNIKTKDDGKDAKVAGASEKAEQTNNEQTLKNISLKYQTLPVSGKASDSVDSEVLIGEMQAVAG